MENEVYLIRKLSHYTVEISKFTDYKEPDAVYQLTNRSCHCPAKVPNCKHKKMYEHWKSLGEPVGMWLTSDLKTGSIL